MKMLNLHRYLKYLNKPVFVFAILGLFGTRLSAGTKTHISVSAKATSIGIEFTVTNTSTETISLQCGDLPSDTCQSIILDAFVLRPFGERLTPIHLLGDPGLMECKLAPGERISGVRKFSNDFEQFAKMHEKSDIILFWYYKYFDPDVYCEDCAGELVIPQDDTSSAK